MKAATAALCAVLWALPTLPGALARESGADTAAAANGSATFNLTDHLGRPFSATQLHGRYTLLTFGFTQCSSTCPVSMQVAREVVAALGAQAPSVVLVTLDPLSDDPARLAAYLRQFDPRFIGLTGAPSAIDRLAAQFRVGRRGAGHAQAHSAMWYLLGPSGELQRTYPLSTPPTQLVDELLRLQATSTASR